MFGYQIANAISFFPEVYKHLQCLTFINSVPGDIPLNNFVVANLATAESYDTGHWVTLFNGNDCIEIFDPLGRVIRCGTFIQILAIFRQYLFGHFYYILAFPDIFNYFCVIFY